MPARNQALTLEKTYYEIPKQFRKNIILSDNASRDETIKIAKLLGIEVIRNKVDKGYGGNMKSCYFHALKKGVNIIVVLHPDNQYDGSKIPELIKPIIDDKADFVSGSRKLGDNFNGMPFYKKIGNALLTWLENIILGLHMSELHSGMTACSSKLLKTIPFMLNSDDFHFHSELIIQAKHFGFRFAEIGIPTRYFKEASSTNFVKSTVYSLGTILVLGKYILHNLSFVKFDQFKSKNQLMVGL